MTIKAPIIGSFIDEMNTSHMPQWWQGWCDGDEEYDDTTTTKKKKKAIELILECIELVFKKRENIQMTYMTVSLIIHILYSKLL